MLQRREALRCVVCRYVLPRRCRLVRVADNVQGAIEYEASAYFKRIAVTGGDNVWVWNPAFGVRASERVV